MNAPRVVYFPSGVLAYFPSGATNVRTGTFFCTVGTARRRTRWSATDARVEMLSRTCGRGVRRHIDMQDASPVVGQDHEDE